MRLALLLFITSAAACGGGKPAGSPADPAKPALTCVKTGCSGTVCASSTAEPMMTTCEMKAEYTCYQSAECKVQDSGECGWTMDDALTACLASPPPLAE